MVDEHEQNRVAYKNAFSVALAADKAFQKELEALFGKKAGDARYDERGKSTPRLRSLSEAKRAADSEQNRLWQLCLSKGEK